MEQGDVELRTKEINHALLVIGHLQGTLDRESGAGVSRNLDRFYCSVRSRLTEAHMRISKEILYEQISNFLSMREAWIEVDRTTQAGTPARSGEAGGDKTTFAGAPAPAMDWGKH
jgi:flagellin-specific chaperone FliS